MKTEKPINAFVSDPRLAASLGLRIGVTRSADSTEIHFATFGNGPPLVLVPSVMSSLDEFTQVKLATDWYSRLAEAHTLVWVERRGIDPSQENADLSLEAHVEDLQAVVSVLNLNCFALLGRLWAGPIAIAYAARYRSAVSHLMLYHAVAKAADHYYRSDTQALIMLIERDWTMFTQVLHHSYLGWRNSVLAKKLAELDAARLNPHALLRALTAEAKFDATPLLPHVSAPALILQKRDFKAVDKEVAWAIANQIPKASITLIKGDEGSIYFDRGMETLSAITAFLGSDGAVDTQQEGLPSVPAELHANASWRRAPLLPG